MSNAVTWNRSAPRAEGYPIYNSVRDPSFVLTNSSKGNRSFVAFFSVSKAYDNGFDWTLGYSWTDAEDVQPMTSSVAFSNYQNRAFFDPQEEVLSTSNYTIAHRITRHRRLGTGILWRQPDENISPCTVP